MNSGQRGCILQHSGEDYLQRLFCFVFFFVFFFLFFSLPFHQSTIIHSVLALKDKTRILIHFFAGAEVAWQMRLFRAEVEEEGGETRPWQNMNTWKWIPFQQRGKRPFFFPLFLRLSPKRLSATLNNSLTVRADLAHQLADKYLKRKAARWEQSALFTSQASTPLVCDGGGSWGASREGCGEGWWGGLQ